MSAHVRWLETTGAVYFAIKEQHRNELRVFGTISYVDHPDYGYHMMTEWGLPVADYPIIKSESRDRENKTARFFLALVVDDKED